MPISPENRKRYPANWRAIRAQILERAGHRCEKCGKPNGRTVAVGPTGEYEDGWAGWFDAAGEPICEPDHDGREIRVVLTIAHLDHTPENCDPSNLRAWCQRCHLRYDREHHAKNAAATRARRKASGTLPLPHTNGETT